MASPFRRPLAAGCALALGASLALAGCERGSDAARASALGAKLFLDPRLSPSGQVACATCHSPAHAFGLDLVTRLCERLLAGGAPGLHFYSMNQSALTLEICKRLGI